MPGLVYKRTLKPSVGAGRLTNHELLDNHLVGFWGMLEEAGGEVHDLKNRTRLRSVSSVIVDGSLGKARQFPSGSLLRAYNVISSIDPAKLTVIAWITRRGDTGSSGGQIAGTSNTGTNGGWLVGINRPTSGFAHQLSFLLDHPGGVGWFYSGYIPPLNKITCGAFTYDGNTSTGRWFVNGVERSISSTGGNKGIITPQNTATYPFTIGGQANSGGAGVESAWQFNGDIHQLAVFDTVVPPDEIKRISNDPLWFYASTYSILPLPALQTEAGGAQEVELAGSQPVSTGTVTRLLAAARALTGSQPTSTGVVTRLLTASRALTGSQPTSTGTVATLLTKYRTLSGDQPSSTGVLTRLLLASRALTGSQPTSTGTINRLLATARVIAGDQPSSTGTLSRVVNHIQSLAGNQSTSTGTLTRISALIRSLTGSQPTATGAVTRASLLFRALTGDQPASIGDVEFSTGTSNQASGSQPSSTGIINRLLAAFRSATGSQPSATGVLTRLLTTTRNLTGSQPSGTGLVTFGHAIFKSEAGDQPSSTGVLTRLVSAVRVLTGAQPFSTGTINRHLLALRTLGGTQPPSSGIMLRALLAARITNGSQPSATGTLNYTVDNGDGGITIVPRISPSSSTISIQTTPRIGASA